MNRYGEARYIGYAIGIVVVIVIAVVMEYHR